LEEVIELSQAGVGEGVIRAQIEASGQVFYLSASEILRLKREGVSEPVIEALIRTRMQQLERERETAAPTRRYPRRRERRIVVVRTYIPTVVVRRYVYGSYFPPSFYGCFPAGYFRPYYWRPYYYYRPYFGFHLVYRPSWWWDP